MKCVKKKDVLFPKLSKIDSFHPNLKANIYSTAVGNLVEKNSLMFYQENFGKLTAIIAPAILADLHNAKVPKPCNWQSFLCRLAFP